MGADALTQSVDNPHAKLTLYGRLACSNLALYTLYTMISALNGTLYGFNTVSCLVSRQNLGLGQKQHI